MFSKYLTKIRVGVLDKTILISQKFSKTFQLFQHGRLRRKRIKSLVSCFRKLLTKVIYSSGYNEKICFSS